MTLQEWLDTNKVYAQEYGKGPCVQVFDVKGMDKWSLYHLDDYLMSSTSSGPSFIMCPRNKLG